MRMHRVHIAVLTALAAVASLFSFALASPAGAAGPGQVVISEWMYNSLTSGKPEFVEITNVGGTPVDMSTYSFDDSSRTPSSFPLSPIGTLAPGDSGLIAEGTVAAFRSEWNLDAGVKIAAGNTNNLGRDDEINIYNGTTLVELTLHSGRNRIVRRMLDAVGHPVLELVRRQFGPLHLGSLPSGRTRDLSKLELGQVLTLGRTPGGAAPDGPEPRADRPNRDDDRPRGARA